jgi:uncharacterized protein
MLWGPRQVYTVRNTTKSTVLGDAVTLADTSLTRLFGLLGKRRLSDGAGLLILPSQGVHTLGMMFPIDVLFLGDDFRVRSVRERLRPFRVTAIDFQTAGVLELPSGTAARTGTTAGDALEFSPPIG